MRPIQTILVLEDLCNTYTSPLYRKGEELSSYDNRTAMDVYQQWLLLMVDLGYLHHDTLKRDAQRLLTDMVTKDVLDLNNAMAEMLHLVRCCNVRGFKALCSRVSSHLYSLIKNDIQSLPSGNVSAARRLVQLFSYTSRLSLADIDLTQQCLDDYMEIEDNMSTYLPRGLTDSLNEILKRWLKSFDPERLVPKHGPGGVSGHGRTSLEIKYKDLTSDALLKYAFGTPWWISSKIPSTLDRISSTIFVPKSYKTFRTISMEPATLQYHQQSIWGEIDRVVASSRFLRSRIGFHEQERNQKLAAEGSFHRNYATIDLSAASDSVSYALVKKVFRGTKLYRYLIATRSSRTLLPDGRLVDLKKFAPMGSALCFPVETLIFAAICQYVTREHGVSGDFSVFGDDIIVPTQCAEDVMITLEVLGFRANREKSFFDPECWFRESCGAEYCDGFDVTPMRVSRKYRNQDDVVHAGSLVDLANTAYQYNFRSLRQFFLRKMRVVGYIPRFAPTGLLSDNFTNYHTERRWNPSLQRIECKVTTFRAKPVGKEDEVLRLRHWMESTRDRLSIGDGFQSRITRVIVSPSERWLEKPYEDHDQAFIDYFTQKIQPQSNQYEVGLLAAKS